MRIAFVSTLAATPWGGCEELWTVTAAKALAAGHEVLLMIYQWPTRHPRIAALVEQGAQVHERTTDRARAPFLAQEHVSQSVSPPRGLRPARHDHQPGSDLRHFVSRRAERAAQGPGARRAALRAALSLRGESAAHGAAHAAGTLGVCGRGRCRVPERTPAPYHRSSSRCGTRERTHLPEPAAARRPGAAALARGRAPADGVHRPARAHQGPRRLAGDSRHAGLARARLEPDAVRIGPGAGQARRAGRIKQNWASACTSPGLSTTCSTSGAITMCWSCRRAPKACRWHYSRRCSARARR